MCNCYCGVEDPDFIFRVKKRKLQKLRYGGWYDAKPGSIKGINISDALGLLDLFGSASDPIIYHGEEMTPTDLMEQHFPLGTERATVRISYWECGKHSKILRLVRGTLQSMCRDRAFGGYL